MFISDHDVHSTNTLKGERIEFSRFPALVFLLLLKSLQRAPHVSRANFQVAIEVFLSSRSWHYWHFHIA